MTQEDEVIVADLALRLDAPRRERNRAALALAVAIALLIDLGAVGLVWLERATVPSAPTEDIPVEIVVEPPPPPPPPPAPEPSPAPAMQDLEQLKPAFDAPREGKSDHDDEHVADKAKPAAAPPPPAATPSPEAAKAAAPPPAPELPKAAEADTPAPQETPQAETPAKALAPVAALPLTIQPVPDIDFGGEAMKSPVTGGKAKSIYTTQLFGIIDSRFHPPAIASAYGRKLSGVVNFSIDGNGRLMERYVAVPSGSLELDESAMEAIGAASRHFPKPPHGIPVALSFNYFSAY